MFKMSAELNIAHEPASDAAPNQEYILPDAAPVQTTCGVHIKEEHTNHAVSKECYTLHQENL